MNGDKRQAIAGPGGLISSLDMRSQAEEMYGLVVELFPICRSITGDGLRETLRRVQRRIPLSVEEVPTGTKAFDWTVPREWNIRDAYIKNLRGERVVDFQRSNLHVVNYSVPVSGRFPLRELKSHIHTLPRNADWIPYRTSYYQEAWGFCMTHNDFLKLNDDEYDVVIDSRIEDGSLSYGELFLPGDTRDEVLVSCHACHPSLCNDNLSGVALAVKLAQILETVSRRYSYRFLFLPGTIGAIVWLSRNEQAASRIRHGLVVACVGDKGPFTYKKSRKGNAEVDLAASHVLRRSAAAHAIREFSPYGYDERQYCSPGFDLPVGVLSRTPYGEFPEYHTSADNLDLVRPEALAESLRVSLSLIGVLEKNRRYRNLNPKCEPQLGRRGIYRATGGHKDIREQELAILWVLNLSDGSKTLLDIAELSGEPFDRIVEATALLEKHGLVEECRESREEFSA